MCFARYKAALLFLASLVDLCNSDNVESVRMQCRVVGLFDLFVGEKRTLVAS